MSRMTFLIGGCIKSRLDGKPKYKARLVTKVFVPVKVVDFQEVSCPAVKIAPSQPLFPLIAAIKLDLTG